MIEIKVPQFAFSLDPSYIRRVMGAVGDEIKADARGLIQNSVGSGRRYHGIVASAPNQPPVNRTGKLVNSIVRQVSVTKKKGILLTIRARDAGSVALEAGAVGGGGKSGAKNTRTSHKHGAKVLKQSTRRVMKPRPFISTAVEQDAPSIGPRLEDAIMHGLQFEKKT